MCPVSLFLSLTLFPSDLFALILSLSFSSSIPPPPHTQHSHINSPSIQLTLGEDPERLHVVSQSNLRGTLEGVYVQNAEMLLDTSQLENSLLTGPYYWRLPIHFQGHKVSHAAP